MITIELGKWYQDRVTGFSGMATCITEYLEGCTRIALQPKIDKEGKIPESHYFDEPRLTEIDGQSYYVDQAIFDQLDKDRAEELKPGGPQPSPRGPEDPTPRED